MDISVIAATIVAVFGLGTVWIWLLQSKAPSARRSRHGLDGLDTVGDWEPRSTRVLTSAERKAYAALMRGLPDHIILAQVPLSRFLRVPTRHSYSEWLSRVGHLCADMVICDPSSQVLMVVEVRGTNPSERALKRQQRIERVLKAAGVRLHVWPETDIPAASTIRALLLPEEEQASKPVRATPPLSELFEPDHAHDYGLHDPPPSTWFDDLETLPPGEITKPLQGAH